MSSKKRHIIGTVSHFTLIVGVLENGL